MTADRPDAGTPRGRGGRVRDGVAVDRVATDSRVADAEARQARLLNTLALAGIPVGIAFPLLVVLAQRMGLVSIPREAFGFAAFPAGSALLSVLCIVLARRGRVRLATQLYVLLTFTSTALGAPVFGGAQSPSWILMLWPVALAGSLLSPRAALTSSIISLGLYSFVAVLESAGVYVPALPMPLDSYPFFSLSFLWIMLLLAVGLVGYVNGTSLNRAMSRLSDLSGELRGASERLAERVDERTQQLQDRAGQLRTIAELIQAAAGASELETLLDGAADLISRRLGYYHVGIFLLDASRRWAVLRAASSSGGRAMLDRGHRLRIGQQGIVGYVAELGISRYAFNVGDDAVWFRNPDLPETSSEMALPLIATERVIGVLDIQSRRPAAFDEDDVETLRVLADGLAVAIENVRRLEEARNALARLERYQESDIVRAWRRALVRRQMQIGFTYHEGVTQRSSATAASRAGTRDLGAVPDKIVRKRTSDGRHLLCAPVSVAGRKLGVLSLTGAAPWSEEAVQLVEYVLTQLDLALTNARLLEETRLQAAREAARSEIVSRIRALNSTDAILRNAAEELGRALRLDRSRIQLVQGNE